MFTTLPHPQKDKAGDAILDETLKDLDKLTDEQALQVCDKVSSLLKNRLAPVKWKSERSACFWNQPSFDWARAAQIAGSVDKGAVASVEVASDVFWGLRVRIQTAVSGSNSADADAEAKEQIQRLITAGGNFSVGATYPWYAYESPTSRVAGVLTSFARVGGAIPALGGEETSQTINDDDVNGSVELAPVDAQLQIQSFRRTISFVLTGRAEIVRGSGKFNKSIGNDGHHGFSYGQLGVGLRFAQVAWFVVSWKKFSSSSIPGTGTTYSLMFGK